MKIVKRIMRIAPHDVRRALYRMREPEKFNALREKRTNAGDEYSFHPFDATKSIFVHIPKAAGISICYALYGGKAGGHTPIASYQLAFSKREFSTYWKFTVVRNPWDRLFSAYSFLRGGGINKSDKAFAESVLCQFATFEEFVLSWVNVRNIRSYLHFIPQTDFLRSYNGHELFVDFIGRYETLQADFEEIKSHLNIKVDLQHLNKTIHPDDDYRAKYTPEMIEAVRRTYARDIALLKYNF